MLFRKLDVFYFQVLNVKSSRDGNNMNCARNENNKKHFFICKILRHRLAELNEFEDRIDLTESYLFQFFFIITNCKLKIKNLKKN
jgi:hypothetical protein